MNNPDFNKKFIYGLDSKNNKPDKGVSNDHRYR